VQLAAAMHVLMADAQLLLRHVLHAVESVIPVNPAYKLSGFAQPPVVPSVVPPLLPPLLLPAPEASLAVPPPSPKPPPLLLVPHATAIPREPTTTRLSANALIITPS